MINIIKTKAAQMAALKSYSEGQIRLTPILNILMNARSRYYEKIGEYLFTKPKITKEINIALPNRKKRLDDDTLRFYGILFNTSMLADGLRRMFGEPLLHDKFGEGVENEDADYASYFVVIDGNKYHIGYDNRGSSIECDPKLAPEQIVNNIKELIDLYEETL